jgi:hypothetical protein
MALIDEVKVACRITTDDVGLTSELNGLIDAAKRDLVSSGILESKAIDTDALVKQCVLFYCKGNFGYDNPDAARYLSAYELMKQHLCSMDEYTVAS